MFHAEDRHWWYAGMQAITQALLDRWCTSQSPLNILDAGCGTGAAMTRSLCRYGRVTGIDISAIALGFCRRRQAQRLGRASISALPFRSETFDLVTSFDVLYEQAVPDDLAALREFRRVLKPGGQALLRLPAYDWLRGQHDQVIHTARRYTRPQVARMLEACGFEAQRISHANTFLFPAALLKRMLERLRPGQTPRSDLTLEAGPLNRFLGACLSLEAPLITRAGLPFGLSVIALARKTAAP
jgi:ubiquinone/menaquinone biosynthesis C-methylase UbiE